MKSPCVSVCKLNKDKVCVGCGRSRKEIGGWKKMEKSEQKEVVHKAERRLKELRK